MVRPGKGITKSLDIRTKSSNKKQKARFFMTGITKEYISNLLRKFKNSLYLGCKIKQFHNKPNEAYLFLIKEIDKLMKIERHVRLHTNFLKLGVNCFLTYQLNNWTCQ